MRPPSAGPACRRLLDEVGIGAERRLQLRKFSKGMLQRVGIAQALINDPELVIFDEPMSGLDPLGRRDVRALILRLRDRGCTVFFSSHVLSDAEALCSRVAILAKGRLVTSGRLTDMLAFQVHGWELVVGFAERHAWRARSRRRRGGSSGSAKAATPSSCRSILRPSACWRSSPPRARTVVSLNPLRETLEDFFVEQVTNVRGPVERRAVEAGRHERHRWIALNVFRESVRDKVLYNLVLFAILLIGASYLIGQLTAGQDVKIIKDLGLGGDVGVRPVHRGLHRHRPGVEGSRAAEHLQPAGQADPSLPVGARQVRRPGADAGVNLAIMAVALYLVLAYMAWQFPAEFIAASKAPPVDPRC